MIERLEGEEGKKRLIELLATQELIVGGNDNVLLAQKLAEVVKLRECKKGEKLYEQGETNISLYFILDGAFDLFTDGKYLRTLYAKQAVGEFPILAAAVKYTVTPRAREESIVAWVSEAQFRKFADENPVVWKNMATVVASRLRETNKLLAESRGVRVLIGHGHSLQWRVLKDFIEELGLAWEEFNRTTPIGVSVTEHLSRMLNASTFALLVLTAEDEQASGSFHARMNVIHELGLSQGRFGFNRAIVLLEEGCETFSNIHGLVPIPFPKDNIAASFDEVRRVLKREGLLPN